MIEPRELGEEGVAYIRERLRSGKTLSSQLLGLDLERGTAWAYLPTDLSEEQAHKFSEGYNLVLSMHRGQAVPPRTSEWTPIENDADPLVASFVQRLLQQAPAAAIWEDALAKAPDPGARLHPEDRLIFVGHEVYYMVDSRVANPDAIAGGFDVMEAWWGSPAVVTTLSDPTWLEMQARSSVTPEHMRSVLEHVRLLFLLAYDGEGYVLWSPDQRPCDR